MVGDAPTASPFESLPAGLADLGAAAAVLIVGGDMADPGMQPDGVVVAADLWVPVIRSPHATGAYS